MIALLGKHVMVEVELLLNICQQTWTSPFWKLRFLIQFDLRDSEVQTEVSLNTHTNLLRDAQMQTESEEAESLGSEHTEEGQDGGKEIKCPLSSSCPHLDVILSEEIDPDFPPLREDIFTFDLEQINHCIMSKETDIVDDFVIL